jgi:C-terminal processing protease CtpA/Prc
MKSKNKQKSNAKIIQEKILEIYPFLTKKEKDSFIKKSKNILNKFDDSKTEEAIRKILLLLNNKHADIKEYIKSDIRLVKKRLSPVFEIKHKILFLNIPSWNILLGSIDKKLIDICFKNIDKYEAIIMDVRNNQGGSSKIAHNFASIFFKENVIYGKFLKKNKKGKIFSFNGELKANRKYSINVPIIILISNKCCSSNELFLAPFKISKRAILVGEKTSGGSGCPIIEEIFISKKKFHVMIPTWRFFLKGKKQPIEKTKIKPDIVYTKKDVKKFVREHLLKI